MWLLNIWLELRYLGLLPTSTHSIDFRATFCFLESRKFLNYLYFTKRILVKYFYFVESKKAATVDNSVQIIHLCAWLLRSFQSTGWLRCQCVRTCHRAQGTDHSWNVVVSTARQGGPGWIRCSGNVCHRLDPWTPTVYARQHKQTHFTAKSYDQLRITDNRQTLLRNFKQW